jgi:hypothetical protein
MNPFRWLRIPWGRLARAAARAGGFIDPVALAEALRRFGKPSEVSEPIELLRAGMVFHARGLVNGRAIQHNLDWIWPYWAERQFNPLDDSFLPRGFAATHVNLTHRDWTALGVPGEPELAIVDPRGLATPHFDGWSLDAWVLGPSGQALFPSRADAASQRLAFGRRPAVLTRSRVDGLSLEATAEAAEGPEGPVCLLRWEARAEEGGWLAVSLRPCNPEGVSFVRRAERLAGGGGWRVNGVDAVDFDQAPSHHVFSTYEEGDVRLRLPGGPDGKDGAACPVGMVTAAALFPLRPGEPRTVGARVPLRRGKRGPSPDRPLQAAFDEGPDGRDMWAEALEGAARLSVPDEGFRFLYQASLRTLVLHTPGDVFAGPYTYKRFWFRDAALILHALACAGLARRAMDCLPGFFPRQRRDGYFLSQEGEWDSNGEALWILERCCRLAGVPPPLAWRQAVVKGADWIIRKRLPAGSGPESGLLPAGFSAEHLGLNDHYYWDDFWGTAGLQAAARMEAAWGDPSSAALRSSQAADFIRAVERSLESAESRLGGAAAPAAPGRRMDAGAVGSLVASYPLQLCAPDDARMLGTAEHLLSRCFVRGGFFQDMVHAGINPYLTLQVAQVLLRAGDRRALSLVEAVAGLAGPTGRWPEAVHPRTGGGCMGDGEHAWAAAEWVMMVRNMFVREEEPGTLVLASGLKPEWLASGKEISFGPAPTPHGPVTVKVSPTESGARVSWTARWRGQAPRVEVRLPGRPPAAPAPGREEVQVARP